MPVDAPPITVEDASAFMDTATEQTTGGHVWQAAHTLLDFLRAAPCRLPTQATVLELGSGTGFLGMNVAREFAVSKLVLTEMEQGEALAWLDRNVQRNRDAGVPLGVLETAALDWSWADSDATDAVARSARIFSERWDVVLGSDLVYNEVGLKMLPIVLARLLARGAVAYYAHTLNRFEFLDRDFFEALSAAGLSCTKVWPEEESDEHGSGAAPASANASDDDAEEADCAFSGELFPEQRIVIFRVVAAGVRDG